MQFVLKPSQWINIGWIIFGIIAFPLVIPPLIALYMIIYVYMFKYEVYEEMIIRKTGVFSITVTEMKMERIKSIRIQKPFLYRLVGLSTIELVSSDPLNPYMKIIAVPFADIIVDGIRAEVEIQRQKKGIKESDIHILH
jgi:hypothetical protein